MMYDTKIGKVSFLNWRWLFGLSINLLVLTIQPGGSAQTDQLLAQSTVEESNRVVNSNTARAALEPKILSEINRVRTDPQGYAKWLEEQEQYFDGIWLRLPGEKPIRTNRGRTALQEAIAALKEQQPLPPLETSEQTAAKATSELERFATANNIQFFSYGRTTATGIVMGLVVDDLFPDRRRRNSLLSSEAEDTGVVCKPDPRYAKVCAIAYSDSTPTADVAEAEPARESVAQLPDPTPVEATPQTSEPEIEPAPETTLTPPSNNTESVSELPLPPQPQVPPLPNNETETEISTGETEVEDAETENTAASTNSDEETTETEDVAVNVPEVVVEAEDVVINVPEEAVEETAETEDVVVNVPEEVVEETTETEDEVEAEIADDDAEVALDSDSSRFLEQVERGSLEEGDRIIDEDGSFYDFYPIEGKQGETYTIYLESDEFDAFVALVDSNGNTIEENDDISQEDSNSRIRVTLPEDGKYNVIVNTYDEDGSGEYILTVTQ